MKFDVKKKIGSILNTFRMEITIGHGDADHFETLYLGPFQKDESFMITGIEKAFKEMEESDKENNNQMEYDHCANFRRFLKKHWKYDLYANDCDIYRYAYMKKYKIIYTDENGIEHQIYNVVSDEEPKRYYYIKINNGRRYCFFAEWDIITTYDEFDSKTLTDWGIVQLENGEEFMKEYHYEKVEIDREDFDEDREFLVTHHFDKMLMETEEEEEKFYKIIEELKK